MKHLKYLLTFLLLFFHLNNCLIYSYHDSTQFRTFTYQMNLNDNFSQHPNSANYRCTSQQFVRQAKVEFETNMCIDFGGPQPSYNDFVSQIPPEPENKLSELYKNSQKLIDKSASVPISELLDVYDYYCDPNYIAMLKKKNLNAFEARVLYLDKSMKEKKDRYKKIQSQKGKNGFREQIQDELAPKIRRERNQYNSKTKQDLANHKDYIESLNQKHSSSKAEKLTKSSDFQNYSTDQLKSILTEQYKDHFNSNEEVEYAKLGLKFVDQANQANSQGNYKEAKRYIQRAEALCITIDDNTKEIRTFYITKEAAADLAKLNISAKQFEEFLGNKAQQLLESELAEIINETGDLNSCFAQEKQVKNISNLVYQTSNIAHTHNKNNDLEKGFAYANFCSGMLNVGEWFTVLFSKAIEARKAGEFQFRGCLNYLKDFVENNPRANIPAEYKELTLNYLNELEQASKYLSKIIEINSDDIEKLKQQLPPPPKNPYSDASKSQLLSTIDTINSKVFSQSANFRARIKSITDEEIAFNKEMYFDHSPSNLALSKTTTPITEIFIQAAHNIQNIEFNNSSLELPLDLSEGQLKQSKQKKKKKESSKNDFEHDYQQLLNSQKFPNKAINSLLHHTPRTIKKIQDCSADLDKIRANPDNYDQKTKELAVLEKAYSTAAIEDLEEGNAEDFERNKKHKQALSKALKKPNKISKQSYELKNSSKMFLLDNEIESDKFEEFEGNIAQQELHNSIITTINEASDLQREYIDNFHIRNITSLTMNAANVAFENNLNQQYINAYTYADLAEGLLKMGKSFALVVIKGVGKGGASIVNHGIDYFRDLKDHPIATILETGAVAGMVFLAVSCPPAALYTAAAIGGAHLGIEVAKANDDFDAYKEEWAKKFEGKSWEDIGVDSIAFATDFFVTGCLYGEAEKTVIAGKKFGSKLAKVVKSEAKLVSKCALQNKAAKKTLAPVTASLKETGKILKLAAQEGVEPVRVCTKIASKTHGVIEGKQSLNKTVKEIVKPFKEIQLTPAQEVNTQEKSILEAIKKNIKKIKTHSPHNINSQDAINRKLQALEKVNNDIFKPKILRDGRIRFYEKERPAHKLGGTRGASYVIEYNPKTNQVRSWNECYDHNGKVNRVHPKMLNGQNLNSQHYPPTKKEISSQY